MFCPYSFYIACPARYSMMRLIGVTAGEKQRWHTRFLQACHETFLRVITK